MSVTIKELVDSSSAATGLTKKVTEQALVAAFAAAGTALKAGQEVTIRDFGRLYPKVRPARQARNPRTGAAVQVAEKTIIKFSPRGSLK